ncbi:MAG: phosphatase PAP2 family protein [Ilumatobacteraceae bacterium]
MDSGGCAALATLPRPSSCPRFLGVESLLVNQGLKRLFRRDRPTTTGDDRYRVRQPSTSSFPSGHASAAFFAARLLTRRSPASWAPGTDSR